MKEDKLEKFIENNFERFNNEEPSPEVWNKISEEIYFKNTKKPLWVQIAAAIFILFTGTLLGIIINQYFATKTPKIANKIAFSPDKVKTFTPIIISHKDTIIKTIKHLNTQNKTKEESIYPEELNEMQAYYSYKINEKRNEIFHFTSNSSEIVKQIDIEFLQFDSIYNNLKNDLQDDMNNQEVIEAMILNYKIRLEILDITLKELKEQSDTTTSQYKIYEI